jgi:hypothetical protein
MISCLLTSVKAETLKAILEGAGLEILAEGGQEEVAEFFVRERGRMPEHLAVIFLFLADLGQELESRLIEEAADSEGGLSA